MRNLHVSRHFDEIAHEYDTTIPVHVRDHYLNRRVELIAAEARRGGRVLDVGCGTGLLANALAARGYVVCGVDVSSQMLRIAKTACKATFVAGEGTELPFRSDFFDVAVCVAAMHHIADPQMVRKTVQEMARVTRPNGHAIIIDHNPLNPYWPLLMKRVPQDCGAERLIALAELLEYARGTGVRTVGWRRMGFTPDFLPAMLLPFWALMERLLENIPGLRKVCAHNVVVLEK